MNGSRHAIRVSAEKLMREAGQRATEARLAVLSGLLAAERALSHREIEASVKVAGKQPDRVTLYRVLEWLVEHGLAHKVAGEDRVWRFNAHTQTKEHGHFHCHRCGQVFCLDDALQAARPRLPRGFRAEHIELTVQGTCAHCRPLSSAT